MDSQLTPSGRLAAAALTFHTGSIATGAKPAIHDAASPTVAVLRQNLPGCTAVSNRHCKADSSALEVSR